MHTTDPIADMLTRIRNASSYHHESVDIPASNAKKTIAEILLSEGYIKNLQVIDDGSHAEIRSEQGIGHHRSPPCFQAGSARLCGR